MLRSSYANKEPSKISHKRRLRRVTIVTPEKQTTYVPAEGNSDIFDWLSVDRNNTEEVNNLLSFSQVESITSNSGGRCSTTEAFEALSLAFEKYDKTQILIIRSIWIFLLDMQKKRIQLQEDTGSNVKKQNKVSSSRDIGSTSILSVIPHNIPERRSWMFGKQTECTTNKPHNSSKAIYRQLVQGEESRRKLSDHDKYIRELQLAFIPTTSFALANATHELSCARIFLCALRYGVSLQRELRDISSKRFNFYLKKRIWSCWRKMHTEQKKREKEIYTQVISRLEALVSRRIRKEAILVCFRGKIRERLKGWNAIRIQRTRKLFVIWKQRMKNIRVSGMLYEFAKNHQGPLMMQLALAPISSPVNDIKSLIRDYGSQQENRANLSCEPSVFCRKEDLFRYAKHPLKGMSSATSYKDNRHITTSLVQRIAFGKWRSAFASRSHDRLANELYKTRLLTKSLHVWINRLGEHPRTRQRRYETVKVVKSAATALLEPHASALAARVFTLTLVTKVWRNWRSRYSRHVADWHYRSKNRKKCFRMWYQKMLVANAHTRIKRMLFQLWCTKLKEHKLRQIALVWRKSTLATTVLATWKEKMQFSRFNRFHRLGYCLRLWKDKTAEITVNRRIATFRFHRCFLGWYKVTQQLRRKRHITCIASLVYSRMLKIRVLEKWKERLFKFRHEKVVTDALNGIQSRRLKESTFLTWKYNFLSKRSVENQQKMGINVSSHSILDVG